MDTPELTVPLPTAALGHAEPRRDGHEPHARDNGQHAVAPAQPRDAAAHGDVLPADLPHVGTGTVLLATGAFIALLLGLFLLGYFPHRAQLAQAAADAAALQNAAPVVNVVRPRRQTQSTDLVLPGDVQALQYTAI